ncbi:MAG TPA: dephospho-CoA kinase [Stellaceae bacterium]|nr:dephospho-CoA kinase [Stellaceae bacterium]
MIVLGLTGSVGMGKSTAASMLRRLGVPVHDSDAEVHRLLGPRGRAVAAVADAFPSARQGNRIDRPRLGRLVFGDAVALKRLESILHPQVRASQARFLAAARRRRAPVVVLDIPLLFETSGERRVDGVIVVSAPAWLQRARVLRRPGMTEARLASILAQQMPDTEKRRRARWVVPTGLGKALTMRRLKEILQEVRPSTHSQSSLAQDEGELSGEKETSSSFCDWGCGCQSV